MFEILGLGLSLFGLGSNIAGNQESAQEAARQAELSKEISSNEIAINRNKKDAFEIQNRRQQIENIRNTQRARALGLNAATNQGAQLGSGLAGGQAQAVAQGGANATNLSQNAIISNWISSYNDNISALNAQMSESKGRQAAAQGQASLGSSLMSGGRTFGNLLSGAGSFSFGNIFSGGGNFSGTPGASNTGGLY